MTPLIDKSLVQRLANRAADFYIDGKVSNLSAAVVDTLGDASYNDQQISRVVEATNQAVWNKLASTGCPHKIRFEPASVPNVITSKAVDEIEVEKTASVRPPPVLLEMSPMGRLEEILFSDMTKTAEEDPYHIPPEELSDWNRIAAKVSMAKEAVQSQLDKCQMDFTEAVTTLVKTANQEMLGGATATQITLVVQQADPGDVGLAMTEVLYKTAFDAHSGQDDSFDAFIARGQATNDGHIDIWDQEKVASVSVDPPGDVNKDHPIYKAVVKIAELRHQALVYSEALEDLSEKGRQARHFAMEGREVIHYV